MPNKVRSTLVAATLSALIATLALAAIGVGPSMDDVNRRLLESAHARCLAVHPYTLVEQQDMRNLVDLGVDGMFTDFPNRLEEVLGEEAVDGSLAASGAAEASRSCRSEAGLAAMPNTDGLSLLLPASLGALLVGLGLLVVTMRRV